MFIVAKAKPNVIRSVNRYLYGGQEIVSEIVSGNRGIDYVVIDAGEFGPVANMLADRLASGMIGAVKFETREEAIEFIAEDKDWPL